MNFPVWELNAAGGGLLVALIAIFHVYIAHFAVGGGLFLVTMEHWAYRTGDNHLLEYIKRHTKFFLIVTMVLGGITGVGIWFIISLLSPHATSILIHTFVFAWATEWVFFAGEIISLFLYFYLFGKIQRRLHLAIGWVYFVCGWMSLFMINGIIGFMLTPGDWLTTRNFWDGFFNPSFWPALVFRTAFALSLAGLYGLVTAAWEKDNAARERLVRLNALWLILPFAALLPSGWWYLQVIPEAQRLLILGGNPEIPRLFTTLYGVCALLVAGGLILAIRMPAQLKRSAAVALLVMGIASLGSFEWIREAGRRPYLIVGHLFSNGVLQDDVPMLSQGYLKASAWNQYADLTDPLAAGKELFRGQCAACHSIGGPLNDIRKLSASFGLMGMESLLTGMGKIYGYMPRFVGTAAERHALASYVASLTPRVEEPMLPRPALDQSIPAFSKETSEYVLLAWCTLGEKCISDCDAQFSLLPPGSTLMAQLVRRGPLPQLVSEGVELRYIAPPGHEHPSGQVDFWKYAKSLVGKELPADTSAKGLTPSGVMHLVEGQALFMANGIPALPYRDDGVIDPYPVWTVEARDAASGSLLASTQVVLPVSTEIGCKNCHGGTWRRQGAMGIAATTASDILARHDRRHQTKLMATAQAGAPVLCQSCHPDPLFGAKGNPDLLNLPAALHGFHVHYLADRPGAEPCHACHPTGPTSYSRCARGVHAQRGMTCVSCHGTLEDHALSLLRAEADAGKPKAKRLMQGVRPRSVDSVEAVQPRTPWKDEPDCLTCHQNFTRPQDKGISAFNTWARGEKELYRSRTDDAGLHCPVCHGPTHAEYPAQNPFASQRDAIQPLQYQGISAPIGARGNCAVCHTMDMEYEFHHENILANMAN
ncbi:cytochrome c family protein [Thermodesulfomicrobium sp. WS]|uniref:cytochrome ubiquinol oxidase subunit I n=1 Tax=Thermodesulfomicrobium sp. WS TaxID=3004129 RepID=UPI0024903FAF|nr:cytochrome ubiquinol oxidase subunit I [Thermodesulfomicrobium sp. WS]BDV00608.1 cytochrome c family protein [Thermodesulfomicrobium sp. WS]